MSRAMLALLLACTVLFPVVAEQTAHGPIAIRSDRDFTAENGVVSGTGLPGDPYVIAGWRIDADGEDYGIVIHGTTRPFVIRNVSIRGARHTGLRLSQTRAGTVQDVRVTGCAIGLSVNMSTRLVLHGVLITHCEDGVRILFSSELTLDQVRIEQAHVGLWASGVSGMTLQNSTLLSCDVGVNLDLGSKDNTLAHNAFLNCRIPAQSEGGNRFHQDGGGNYWGGYEAPDEDSDGILDRPYHVVGGDDRDPFPLAAPPRVVEP